MTDPLPRQQGSEATSSTQPEPYILSDETIPAGAYAGLYRKVMRDIVIISIVGFLVASFRFGTEAAEGMVVGAIFAALNFWWMQRSMTALTDVYATVIREKEIADADTKPDVSLVPQAVRFFLRYLLIGSVPFVMMRSHREAALGYFAGLLLPVAALMLEALLLLSPSSKNKELS